MNDVKILTGLENFHRKYVTMLCFLRCISILNTILNNEYTIYYIYIKYIIPF